jgi:hypothetical protein
MTKGFFGSRRPVPSFDFYNNSSRNLLMRSPPPGPLVTNGVAFFVCRLVAFLEIQKRRRSPHRLKTLFDSSAEKIPAGKLVSWEGFTGGSLLRPAETVEAKRIFVNEMATATLLPNTTTTVS